MRHLLIATEEERLRATLVEQLSESGYAVRTASTWPALLRGATEPDCALILVDGSLQSLQPELLAQLCESLPRAPEVRSIGAPAPPIRSAPARSDLLLRLARRVGGVAALSSDERREIRCMGLGDDALQQLARLAASPIPVYLEGERGAGKKRVARYLHRLSARSGSFVVVEPEAAARWAPDGPPGTLFLKALERWGEEPLFEVQRRAEAAGWRLIGGSRQESGYRVPGWAPLRLAPLRERHDDLRALTLIYLDRHRRLLGLPRRRLDRALWDRIYAHQWPENNKELEAFTQQLLVACPSSTIRGAALPPHVRRLLEPSPDSALRSLGMSFEETVIERLRPMVRQYEHGAGIGLHKLVIDATERALILLALARTGGNQKAAAELLGLARNTLRAKAQGLGLVPARRRR